MASNYVTVQYQVLIRPVDSEGKIFRGLEAGDSVYGPIKTSGQYPNYTYSSYRFKGEPWLVFSTAASLEQARASAKKAAMSVGGENVRIVKVLPHDMDLII